MKERAWKDIIKAIWPALIGVLIMGLMFLGEEWDILQLRSYGIRPRLAKGLPGILLTPFLHGSTEHLFNNSIPLLVLGWCLFYFYRDMAWATIFWIVICGGLWVWLSGRPGTNHIGASGLVYGLVAFLFLSGILRKHVPLIAISMLVVFLYGSLIWGIFPVQEHISWEGHLWGAVAGFLMAVYYRPLGPQRPKYDWEEEAEEEIPYEEQYWNHLDRQDATISDKARPYRIVYHVKKKSTASPASSDADGRSNSIEGDKSQD